MYSMLLRLLVVLLNSELLVSKSGFIDFWNWCKDFIRLGDENIWILKRNRN